MKSKISLIAAVILCCASCVDVNNQLGGSLLPVDQTYEVYSASMPIQDISVRMADSLSGYSSTRITLGAIRESEYGLTTRSCAMTLIPTVDTMDFGTNPQLRFFSFQAALDTVSMADPAQRNILQRLRVHELTAPTRALYCNSDVIPSETSILAQPTYLNGTDSLSFNFSEAYAQKFFALTQNDLSSIDKYLAKIPGIYLSVDAPVGEGGRINMFDLQLDYSKSAGSVLGNYATLAFRSTYNGNVRDTAFYFYYGADDLYPMDSLLNKSSTGSFPQYCLNLTGQSTRERQGKASDRIMVEGGGGLKPVISARSLRDMARKAIVDSLLAAGKSADLLPMVVINRASLVLPFEVEQDYRLAFLTPYILSPTCRIRTDTTSVFMGLTDSSDSKENQGDIDRSNLQFAPDITYHLQALLKMDDTKIDNGNYDIWLLTMAKEEVTTASSAADDEMSEYYQYLAYQSYYNDMYGYGGYGGYGYGGYGYGYGGYGGGYSNYYSYMMAAMYMNANSSTTSLTTQLDISRFYRFALNGPASAGRRPELRLVFSVPNKD